MSLDKTTTLIALKTFQAWENIQIRKCDNADVDTLACLRAMPSSKEGWWVRVET